jgi:hypothetical protein
MAAGRRTALEEHVVHQTTRALLFASLIGLALSGPAFDSRLVGGLQVWLTHIWVDSGDAGSIMDPNG